MSLQVESGRSSVELCWVGPYAFLARWHVGCTALTAPAWIAVKGGESPLAVVATVALWMAAGLSPWLLSTLTAGGDEEPGLPPTHGLLLQGTDWQP